MPGPIGLPIIGAALPLLYRGRYTYIFLDWLCLFFFFLFSENLELLEIESKKYEHLHTPIHIWFGTSLFIYVDCVQDVETILTATECINREDNIQYLQEVMGVNGLFTLHGTYN